MSNNIKQTLAKRGTIVDQYLKFCDEQMVHRVVWFLVPLVTLSTAIMPLGLLCMFELNGYVLYSAISIILFFGNIVASVSQQHTRVLVSLYIFTIAVNAAIPIASFLWFS